MLSVLILGAGSPSIVAGEGPEPAHLEQAPHKCFRVKAESACRLPPERTVICFQMSLLMFLSSASVLIIGIRKGKY